MEVREEVQEQVLQALQTLTHLRVEHQVHILLVVGVLLEQVCLQLPEQVEHQEVQAQDVVMEVVVEVALYLVVVSVLMVQMVQMVVIPVVEEVVADLR
jgi:hypothetical protein